MKDGLDICLLIMGVVVLFQVEMYGKPSSTSPVKTNFSTARGEKIGMEEKRQTWREEKGKIIFFPGKYDVLVEFKEKFTEQN